MELQPSKLLSSLQDDLKDGQQPFTPLIATASSHDQAKAEKSRAECTTASADLCGYSGATKMRCSRHAARCAALTDAT